MLPHHNRYDANAFQSAGWATLFWMRSFAALRMTTEP
jgi:hypothetical protein